MKRFPFLILLSAIAGAIGLSLVMWACGAATIRLFPNYFAFGFQFGFFVKTTLTSSEGRLNLLSGALLGIGSALFWRKERTLWSQLTTIICALCSGTHFLWILKDVPQGYAAGITFASMLAYYLPPTLWALALFFFAILTRQRKPAA